MLVKLVDIYLHFGEYHIQRTALLTFAPGSPVAPLEPGGPTIPWYKQRQLQRQSGFIIRPGGRGTGRGGGTPYHGFFLSDKEDE